MGLDSNRSNQQRLVSRWKGRSKISRIWIVLYKFLVLHGQFVARLVEKFSNKKLSNFSIFPTKRKARKATKSNLPAEF